MSKINMFAPRMPQLNLTLDFVGLGRTEHMVHLLSLTGALPDVYKGPWSFALQIQASA